MIPTLLVTSHTDLELYGFDVNYVPAISKYSITCISSMKKTVVVGLTPKQCTLFTLAAHFLSSLVLQATGSWGRAGTASNGKLGKVLDCKQQGAVTEILVPARD